MSGTPQPAAARDIKHTPPDLEGTGRCLERQNGRHNAANAYHDRREPVRQFGDALGHSGQSSGRHVSGRADGIANATHGVVSRLHRLRPLLGRGFAALGQVLVEDAADLLRVGRVGLQLVIQSPVLPVNKTFRAGYPGDCTSPGKAPVAGDIVDDQPGPAFGEGS